MVHIAAAVQLAEHTAAGLEAVHTAGPEQQAVGRTEASLAGLRHRSPCSLLPRWWHRGQPHQHRVQRGGG